jgi:hypothetical protein
LPTGNFQSIPEYRSDKPKSQPRSGDYPKIQLFCMDWTAVHPQSSQELAGKEYLMQDQVLFPLHEDLAPDPTRTEPSVWIRRLYILGEPNIDSLIREVPFERGLNIIRTEERGESEEHVVAHSVGKTMLMRLIRYTLGERNYASEESQAELAKQLPNGLVVAHWQVNGEDWLVLPGFPWTDRLALRKGCRASYTP